MLFHNLIAYFFHELIFYIIALFLFFYTLHILFSKNIFFIFLFIVSVLILLLTKDIVYLKYSILSNFNLINFYNFTYYLSLIFLWISIVGILAQYLLNKILIYMLISQISYLMLIISKNFDITTSGNEYILIIILCGQCLNILGFYFITLYFQKIIALQEPLSKDEFITIFNLISQLKWPQNITKYLFYLNLLNNISLSLFLTYILMHNTLLIQILLILSALALISAVIKAMIVMYDKNDNQLKLLKQNFNPFNVKPHPYLLIIIINNTLSIILLGISINSYF